MSPKLTYTQDELIVLIRDRDQKAFSYLYDNYSQALFNVVNYIVNDIEESEDVIQNTFLKIWNNFASYDSSKGRLYTWMLNIARNLAIDSKRSKHQKIKSKIQNTDDAVYDRSSLSVEDKSHESIGLKKILNNLKEDHQVIIDLAYFEGYTQEEISKKTKHSFRYSKNKSKAGIINLKRSHEEGVFAVKVSEVISSGLLETYVVGAATDDEIKMIRELSREHPELIKEIESIEAQLIDFSARTTKPLNPALKEKISKQLVFKKSLSPTAKVVPLQENKIMFYKFGMAASLLLFATSFFYTVLLQQKVNRLNNEVADLSSSKSYMADELKVQQTSLSAINSELQIVTDPNIKKIALKGMKTLAANSAVIHWNTQTNEVYFNASALPVPTNKQYQLWAIVDGKPVDAGMIDLNGDFVFQKMKSISGASAFAVTIENQGGSAAPTLETMCLLGNV